MVTDDLKTYLADALKHIAICRLKVLASMEKLNEFDRMLLEEYSANVIDALNCLQDEIGTFHAKVLIREATEAANQYAEQASDE